ncbi:MAG: hypothetical protein ACI9N9_002481 [Enterobacterales bacterium]|jgi:hypothetical protein
MKILLFIIGLLFLSINSEAAKKKTASKSISINKKKCAGVNKKMQRINSQLKAGYNLKKGEVLKDKLRKLEKQKYACSRKRFPTK